MVRKGGLEPPCLSAPPPQDGVSANFTTSALQHCVTFNELLKTLLRGFPQCIHFVSTFCHPGKKRRGRVRLRIDGTHARLDVIVACRVLQREGVLTGTPRSQKQDLGHSLPTNIFPRGHLDLDGLSGYETGRIS